MEFPIKRYSLLFVSVSLVSLTAVIMSGKYLKLDLKMSSEYAKPSYAIGMTVPPHVKEVRHLEGTESRYNSSTKPIHPGRIKAKEATDNTATDLEHTFKGDTLPQADCTKRLLIFECTGKAEHVCSGLADRQRGMMSSFLLALLANRTFSIRHIYPCSLSNFFLPNKYDWLKCLPNYNTSSDIRYVNLFYGSDINNMPDIAGFPSGNIWKEQIVVIRTNKHLFTNITRHPRVKYTIPWLLRWHPNSIQHGLFHILFKLETSFKVEIDRYIDDITHHQSRDLVGVHIRTEFINVDDDLDNILKFADQFSDTSKYAIYIATDNEIVRQKAVDRFNGSLSSNVSGMTLHVDSGRATCTSFHLAVFEQQVLARSNIIIKTQSGFSTMSILIRGRGPGLAYLYTKPSRKGAGQYFIPI